MTFTRADILASLKHWQLPNGTTAPKRRKPNDTATPARGNGTPYRWHRNAPHRNARTVTPRTCTVRRNVPHIAPKT